MNIYQMFLFTVGSLIGGAWLITLIKLFVVDTVRHYHRKQYMKKHGFHYGIKKLTGYYNIELWGYTRGEENVDEQEIDHMNFHALRERFN